MTSLLRGKQRSGESNYVHEWRRERETQANLAFREESPTFFLFFLRWAFVAGRGRGEG